MKKKKLSKILKEAIKIQAFDNLLEKHVTYSKGSNLIYGQFKMREYFTTKSMKLLLGLPAIFEGKDTTYHMFYGNSFFYMA